MWGQHPNQNGRRFNEQRDVPSNSWGSDHRAPMSQQGLMSFTGREMPLEQYPPDEGGGYTPQYNPVQYMPPQHENAPSSFPSHHRQGHFDDRTMYERRPWQGPRPRMNPNGNDRNFNFQNRNERLPPPFSNHNNNSSWSSHHRSESFGHTNQRRLSEPIYPAHTSSHWESRETTAEGLGGVQTAISTVNDSSNSFRQESKDPRRHPFAQSMSPVPSRIQSLVDVPGSHVVTDLPDPLFLVQSSSTHLITESMDTEPLACAPPPSSSSPLELAVPPPAAVVNSDTIAMTSIPLHSTESTVTVSEMDSLLPQPLCVYIQDPPPNTMDKEQQEKQPPQDSDTSKLDFIYIQEVEWADPKNPDESREKAIRPKYSSNDGPCLCTKQESSSSSSNASSPPLSCRDSSCVLFACQEECRSDCLAGDLCGNKRITQKKWKSLQVFDAGVKGKGLKTLQDIQATDFIIEYCGVAVQKKYLDTVVRRYRSERMLYIMALDNDVYIDARVKGCEARFMNHSCEPNCAVHRWKVRGIVRAGVFALRDIVAGEELTFDYKWERKRGRAPTKCHCNTPDCRGTLELQRDEDEDALDIDLNGHWIVPTKDYTPKDDLVDKIIQVFITEDHDYYLADVCRFDRSTGLHCLMYRGDEEEYWEDLKVRQWMMLDDQVDEFVISKKKKAITSHSQSPSTNVYSLDSSLSAAAKECSVIISTSLKQNLNHTILDKCRNHHRVEITMIAMTESDINVGLFRPDLPDTSNEPTWKFIITGSNPEAAKDYLEKNIRALKEKLEMEASSTTTIVLSEAPSSFIQEIIVPRCIFDTLKSQLPRIKSLCRSVNIFFSHSESKTKYFAKLILSGMKIQVEIAQTTVWREILSLCKQVDAPRTSVGQFKDFAFYGGSLTESEYRQLFFPKTVFTGDSNFKDITHSPFLKAFEEKFRCVIWIQPENDRVGVNTNVSQTYGNEHSNDTLKIYFSCDPKRIEELFNVLKSRAVCEIKSGVEYLDLGADIIHLHFLSDLSKKIPFFRFVEYAAEVNMMIDPFTRSLIRICPSSSNNTIKGYRLAREIVGLQLELLRDYQARHRKWFFGCERNLHKSVLSIESISSVKHRLTSATCMEICDVISSLKLHNSIAAHACTIFYRYLSQSNSAAVNAISQTKMRELSIACIYLANKSQKICRWKRLSVLIQAACNVFYGDSSKDSNSSDVWEKRVLACENELLATLQFDIFWVGTDWILMAAIDAAKISEPLAANVMDITLSGPVLAVGARLWLDLGPQYAFAAVAALLSINIDPLFDILPLVPHNFVLAVELIEHFFKTSQKSHNKISTSKNGHELFGGVKSLIATKEDIVEKLRNRSFHGESSGRSFMRSISVAGDSYIRKALRVTNLKYAQEEIIPNISITRSDSGCEIFFTYPSDAADAMDFILEGDWRSISLAEHQLFPSHSPTTIDVSTLYYKNESLSSSVSLVSSDLSLSDNFERIKNNPGVIDTTSLSKSKLKKPYLSSGKKVSSVLTGNICQVPNDLLYEAGLRWLSSPTNAAVNGFLVTVLQKTTMDDCKHYAIVHELTELANSICTKKSPRSKSYPMLDMIANLASYTHRQEDHNEAALSMFRWPPRKMEMKELSKNGNFIGLSPSALQEMQLLHQIHFLIPNPRGHPNFALPVSIAYDGGVKKPDNSSGDTSARSSSPTDLLFSASRINGNISHHGPNDSQERAAIIKGNYLLCCPTPFSLQAVLSLRKRKNEDHHALDVSPIIIQLWFRDLLSALSHCHSNHILLRTIHPNQILIDNSGVAKIGNLYRCHVLHPEERGQDASKDSKTKKGAKEAVDADDIRSNNYLAPELVFGSPRYTKKSDVWALGCLIAHVILEKILFFGKDRNSVANAMFKVVGSPSSDVAKKFGDYPFFKSIVSTVDPSKMKKYKKNVSKAIRTIMNDRSHHSEEYDEILGLLELMLDLDPDKRISASEALEHATMRNLSIYSLTPQFRQLYVHDWTRFKKQYEESLDKIVASGMDVSEDFLSDDEDDGYNQKSKLKGRKSEDEVLDYFDIEDIVTQSSSKRPRVV